MTSKRVNVLYFDGCPSWQQGVENLRAALDRLGLDWSVELEQVPDDQRATQLRFLGSPSFQVDGQDLWPEARETYSLSCRVYVTPQGLKGWPTVEMLEARLRSV
jgi:prepilin-type processing-associated H-X9-DG protein